MTRFFILIVCLFSVSAKLSAQPIETSDTQKLSSFLKALDDVQANFVQHTLDGNQSLLNTQKGVLFLSKPNKFKWESEAPYEQILVSNGTTLWQYDPDLEQATIQKLDERLSSTPVLLLSGDYKKLSSEYDVYGETLQDESHFVLIPKRNDALFDRLRLEFNGQKNLTRMVIKDEVGQQTIITLSSVKKHQSFDRSIFEFTVPEGTDVIETR